jgi:hypothetical protein
MLPCGSILILKRVEEKVQERQREAERWCPPKAAESAPALPRAPAFAKEEPGTDPKELPLFPQQSHAWEW